MLIRAATCLVLILASLAAATPPTPANLRIPLLNHSSPALDPAPFQLNGTQFAFNSTLGHFDLYTNTTNGFNTSGNGTLTWFSKFSSTKDGSAIPGTAFNYTVPRLASATRWVNWTLNIPSGGKFQSSLTTYVKFHWSGNLTSGTSARYFAFNGTGPMFRRVVPTGNFTGSPANVTSIQTGPPVSCGATDECFDVTKFVGYNVTLAFLFNSTAIGRGLRVQVSNIQVASVTIIRQQSSSHWMFLDPSDSSRIVHFAEIPLNYSSFVKYNRGRTSQVLNHTWTNMVLSMYWPTSYNIDNVTVNGNKVFPTASPTIPLSQGQCVPIVPILECTDTTAVSLNMTSPNDTALNKIALFTARSLNAINSLRTALGTASTDFWTPGDNITLKVVNNPGVEQPGTQAAWFTSPFGLPEQNSTLTNLAPSGTSNYTITLPTSPLGNWNITAIFTNTYDYGIRNHQFRIDEIQVKPGTFTLSGSAGTNPINAGGTLAYMSNQTLAGNVNATVFAISTGLGAGVTYTKGSTSTTSLYISNITLASGLGTIGQPVTMTFSLINPNATKFLFSANLTIDHEWYSGQTHGVNSTIQLKLGDEPFTKLPLNYVLQASFTSNGIQLTIRSLQTGNAVTVSMTPGIGTSAVPSLRQHFGLFRLTLHSNSTTSGPVSTSSLESPPYAYILYQGIVPGQVLAYSPTFGTSPTGMFTTTISSGHLLGAKNLLFIVLARDPNGVVLGDSGHSPVVASDSTLITTTTNAPRDATVGQSVTVTLHMKSNSTILPMALTVNLDLTSTSASIPTQAQSVSIAPGATQDVSFTFTAPSTAGVYTMTISSPQYGSSGSPLLTKTVVISLVSSNLQILIPAVIGLAAAVVILGVYMTRRGPGDREQTGSSEETKPAAKTPKTGGQLPSKSLTRG